MLYKISNTFYIDMEEIYLIDKCTNEIKIYVRKNTQHAQPFLLNSRTKLARDFLAAVDKYFGYK